MYISPSVADRSATEARSREKHTALEGEEKVKQRRNRWRGTGDGMGGGRGQEEERNEVQEALTSSVCSDLFTGKQFL